MIQYFLCLYYKYILYVNSSHFVQCFLFKWFQEFLIIAHSQLIIIYFITCSRLLFLVYITVRVLLRYSCWAFQNLRFIKLIIISSICILVFMGRLRVFQLWGYRIIWILIIIVVNFSLSKWTLDHTIDITGFLWAQL